MDAMLYSTDSLNRFKIEKTTIGNVSDLFLVKKIDLATYFSSVELSLIKSNVFFRSDFMSLREAILTYNAHVFNF